MIKYRLIGKVIKQERGNYTFSTIYSVMALIFGLIFA